jgi:hypothetical protein
MMPFTSNVKNATTGRNSRGAEMSKYIIGPMAADIFLDTFFPKNELFNLDDVPNFLPHCYKNTIHPSSEALAYLPFVSKHVW